MTTDRSAFLEAVKYDNSLPIEKEAVELWLKDLENPFRWTLRPIAQFFLAILLHVVWFLKRLPLPQFSAHKQLQATICWFCRNFVSYEANMLILRHFATESNILNFLADNSSDDQVQRLALYPKSINEMMVSTFIDHDQELFRIFKELGYWESKQKREPISWEHWQTIDMQTFQVERKRTQVIDFETAHALFMCLFCLLLKRDEYRDAINGFNLDQSMAIRIGEITKEPGLPEMAYNKYPHYLVGPWNLGQRFLMHGFFTEYLYAKLENLRTEQ